MCKKVLKAYDKYLKTIPDHKKKPTLEHEIKDVVETKGIGIRSTGYRTYTFLLEGENQALENNIVLSMKEGQRPSVSRLIEDEHLHAHFSHHGHRTVLSQRALQANSDPWLGYTKVDNIGMVVSELSPYLTDLEWDDIDEMEELMELSGFLGKAVAQIHCVSDIDSDQNLVPFNTGQAIYKQLKNRKTKFRAYLTDFAHTYGEQVREDYNVFVDAFRNRKLLK